MDTEIPIFEIHSFTHKLDVKDSVPEKWDGIVLLL